MFARHILVCSHSLLRVSLHKYGFWVTIFFHHVLPRCCYIVGLMTLLSIPWHSCSLHMLGCLVAVPIPLIACEICPALSQSLELALCWTYLSFAMGFTNFKWMSWIRVELIQSAIDSRALGNLYFKTKWDTHMWILRLFSDRLSSFSGEGLISTMKD